MSRLRVLPLLACISLVSAAGCTSDPGRPTRVVFVTLDTLRADRIGTYGYDQGQTPNLDRFAMDSALFQEAVSPIPTTLPSHATMFTGLYPYAHGVRYNVIFRLAEELPTLAELLRDAGFATAAVPAAFVVSRGYGIDQGFETFYDPPGAKDDNAPATMGRLARDLFADTRTAADGVDLTLQWLAGQNDRRAFIWLHIYEPHHPYDPPFPYSSTFRERPYDGEIAYADEQVGRLLTALRDSPEWARTLVILVGDHGEGLYDHDERFHGNLVYESTQRVPLIIRAPGGKGVRVTEPVGLVDVMPTVLDLVGVPIPDGLQGISLRGALAGEGLPTRDIYFESLAGAMNYGWAELRGVRRGEWKLIDSPDPELFNLERDPDEQVNLAAAEPDRVEELRAALAGLTRTPGTVASPVGLHGAPDDETQRFLASLGYVGGGGGTASPENAPRPRDLIAMDGELLAAQIAVARREWPEVDRLARYILDRDPTNKWALHNDGFALLQMGRFAEAERLGLEMLRLYPDVERGYTLLGRAYQAQGQADEAYDVLQLGLSTAPVTEGITYLALLAAFDLGRADVCTVQVAEAYGRFPDSAEILLLQARCAAREGDPQAALGWLSAAVRRGFRELRGFEQADDFSEVVKLPGFARLAADLEGRATDRVD